MGYINSYNAANTTRDVKVNGRKTTYLITVAELVVSEGLKYPAR